MIVLFTDFGLSGPYTGQVKAVLAQQAPGVPVIDLFADAPVFDPQLSAYLLAAYAPAFPAGGVFVCVVDPGVGTDRRPLVVEADGRFFVGPDNGLFELVRRRAASFRAWSIDWQPERLSASFHGRDLFAPVAARLATGREVARTALPDAAVARPDWPDELPRIVYVDVYGNAMTGLRAATLAEDAVLTAGGWAVLRGRTFADAAPGEALWYGNSNGLAEIAVNRGRADVGLGLRVGADVTVTSRSIPSPRGGEGEGSVTPSTHRPRPHPPTP
ncbi:S-adenosylmethionine hydrolase [Azospirillum agricola]|uniref:SAM hydrolase/SAM-dependent halogenase family protein n=1 Tax=Azospirillum agricola TaxID=1720247 RepID=UPI001AE305D8|nr:SAM-dependent chlorinase/fluorinase [Azospirillum agricola]MBP2229757.1 S-adenosylmethionine hydrolase [Azospirillum agricola]